MLQLLDDAQALLGVAEALWDDVRQRLLAGVAERWVADVVGQGDRFGQVFVQVQRPRDRARDLGDLQRVREPGDEVVADGGDEHLRLVFEAPERFTVQDAVAVTLELCADGRRLFGRFAAAAAEAVRRVGRQGALPLFEAPADGR